MATDQSEMTPEREPVRRKTGMMDLPQELRLQILAEICAPYRGPDLPNYSRGTVRWLPHPTEIPPEIASIGMREWYFKRSLIFELPKFSWSPRTTRRHRIVNPKYNWPRAFRVRDNKGKIRLDQEIGSRAWVQGKSTTLSFTDLSNCPFYRFSSHLIKIPVHSDLEGFIVNWSRLRVISLLFESLTSTRKDEIKRWGKSLVQIPNKRPHVKIVFDEANNERWMAANSSPRMPPRYPDRSSLEHEDYCLSDVVLLLRALAPLAQVAQVTVEAPAGFDEHELELVFDANKVGDHHLWLYSYNDMLETALRQTNNGALPSDTPWYLRHYHHGPHASIPSYLRYH